MSDHMRLWVWKYIRKQTGILIQCEWCDVDIETDSDTDTWHRVNVTSCTVLVMTDDSCQTQLEDHTNAWPTRIRLHDWRIPADKSCCAQVRHLQSCIATQPIRPQMKIVQTQGADTGHLPHVPVIQLHVLSPVLSDRPTQNTTHQQGCH